MQPHTSTTVVAKGQKIHCFAPVFIYPRTAYIRNYGVLQKSLPKAIQKTKHCRLCFVQICFVSRRFCLPQFHEHLPSRRNTNSRIVLWRNDDILCSVKENCGLNTDAFTLKRWPNVRVIFTYGSVTHHRQFIYKILLTKLFPVFSVQQGLIKPPLGLFLKVMRDPWVILLCRSCSFSQI